VLRFNYQWSDYERKQAKHMHETFQAIYDGMGATPITPMPTEENDYGLNKPGEIIHEVGTARMGNDPRTSATNKWQQLHDVPNVYLADGATFVSQADKNPTWTILALAWRMSDHIIDQLKKQNL